MIIEFNLSKIGMDGYNYISFIVRKYITRNDNNEPILFDDFPSFHHQKAMVCWLPEKRKAAMYDGNVLLSIDCKGKWGIIE